MIKMIYRSSHCGSLVMSTAPQFHKVWAYHYHQQPFSLILADVVHWAGLPCGQGRRKRLTKALACGRRPFSRLQVQLWKTSSAAQPLTPLLEVHWAGLPCGEGRRKRWTKALACARRSFSRLQEQLWNTSSAAQPLTLLLEVGNDGVIM